MQLAVVIVTWNVRDLALQALRTLYDDLAGFDAQVYVVDSASSDGTAEAIMAEFPQADVYASPENLGFGKGNNHAIKRIMALDNPPDAIYLLNPDTITHPGATSALYDALMVDDKLGLVGARLSYEDGSFQHGAFAFPGLRQLWVEFFPTPGRFIEGEFNGRYPRGLYDAGVPFPVDFTLGATMMLKHQVIAETSGFDEDFFMYCEEIDWAWRIHNAGWDVQCVPAAHITHLSGQSTGQVKPQSIINLWESRLHLFKKHYPAWKLALAKRMVMMGMKRKIRETDSQDLIQAYQTVIRMAS